MSDDRTELAKLIDDTINAEYDPGDDVLGDVIADALLDAGYRKPRLIENYYADGTLDLSTLRPKTVVLSAGAPLIVQGDGTYMDHDGSTWDFWEVQLPVTVIWESDEEDEVQAVAD